MNRRQFLKGSLTLLMAGWAPTLRLEAHAQALGKRYRGTHDGKIFTSRDDGESWQLAANFGSSFSVLGIYPRKDTIYAQLGFPGGYFFLKSADDHTWCTSDFIPPAGRALAPRRTNSHG